MSSKEPQITESIQIPSLTGVRFLAVVLVYFHHFNPTPKDGTFGFLHGIFQEGYIGVTLFFVLSGFIITYRYFLSSALSLPSYFWNRFSKIYPVYFLLTLLTLGWNWHAQTSLSSDDWLTLFLNLSLLKGFFSDFIFTGIPQAWTLTVEECFYISAPLFAFALRKSIKLTGILILFVWGLGLLLINLPNQLIFYGLIPDAFYLFNYTFFGRILEFVFGMGLAFTLGKKTRFRYFTLLGCTNIGLSFILLSYFAEPGGFGDQTYQGILTNNLFLPLFGILPLIWGLIHENTLLRQVFSSKLFIILGESSYVFYLIHMGIFHDYLVKIGFSYFSVFCMLYLLSIMIYFGFEKPVKVWLRRFRIINPQSTKS